MIFFSTKCLAKFDSELRFEKFQRLTDRKSPALLKNAIKSRGHRAQKIPLPASSIFTQIRKIHPKSQIYAYFSNLTPKFSTIFFNTKCLAKFDSELRFEKFQRVTDRKFAHLFKNAIKIGGHRAQKIPLPASSISPKF